MWLRPYLSGLEHVLISSEPNVAHLLISPPAVCTPSYPRTLLCVCAFLPSGSTYRTELPRTSIYNRLSGAPSWLWTAPAGPPRTAEVQNVTGRERASQPQNKRKKQEVEKGKLGYNQFIFCICFRAFCFQFYFIRALWMSFQLTSSLAVVGLTFDRSRPSWGRDEDRSQFRSVLMSSNNL